MGRRKRKSAARSSAAGKRTQKQSLIEKLIDLLKGLGTQKKKLKPKNEFRTNRQEGNHPNYIFAEKGKKYRSLGITHHSETFGKKNMPLEVNPKKGDGSPAYIRNGIISSPKKSYSEKTLNDFRFGKEDYPNVKSKIRNYKKKVKEQEHLAKKRAKEKQANKMDKSTP